MDFNIFPDEKTKNQALFILDKAIFYSLINEDDGDCFYLDCKELKLAGKGYAKAKQFLIDHGILISNGFYWYSAHHATEYELAPEYRLADKWRYFYKTGDKFGERLANLKKTRLKAKIKAARHAKEVCITKTDLKGREAIYSWVHDISISKTTLDLGYHIEAQMQKKKAQTRYWEDCGTMVTGNPYEPYISPLSGRMYYLGCSFPKKSRKYILLDNKPTSEVDVSCAQPYFCVSLYNLEDEAHLRERERYLEFIRTDDFYTGLNKAAGMPCKDRDEAKTAAYTQILFGSEKAMHMPLGRALKAKFPILYWEIYNTKKNHPNSKDVKIKTIYRNGQKMKKGSGNIYFSVLLQKTEADITFAVVEKLMERGIYCLTVHDSIRVQSEYTQLVYDLYMEECFKQIGVDPILHIDHPERKAA